MVEGGRKLSKRARVRRNRTLVCVCAILVASLVAGSGLEAFAGSGGKKRQRVERKHGHKQKKGHKRKIRYAFPVWKKLATSGEIRAPHHDYPAWDLPVHVGTKIRSVTSGRVKSVTRWGACGKGVIVKGHDGYTYTYCHGSALAVRRGWKVWPGRVLMRSGSTGHSTGPHLHLQIERRGRKICPQPLLAAWKNGRHRSPASSGRWACFYGPGSGRERAVKRHKARVRREQKAAARKDKKRLVRSKRRSQKTDRSKPRRAQKKDRRRSPRRKMDRRDRAKKSDRKSAVKVQAQDRVEPYDEEILVELPILPEVPKIASVEEPVLLIVKPIHLLH